MEKHTKLPKAGAHRDRRNILCAAAVVIFLFRVTPPIQGQTFQSIYSFSGGADGLAPWATLVRDPSGNLYGTTYNGGDYSLGTVFKVDPAGHETVLHSFAGGNDGERPQSGVIRDRSGNLYGTTPHGGLAGDGVIFKVDPFGNETVVFSFRDWNGAYSYAPLMLDAAGNFYGTTAGGGADGLGTLFKLDSSRKETVLHSFSFVDGANPIASLIEDGSGNLYGTAQLGGAANLGVVFKLGPTGIGRILYSFAGNGDGATPIASLIRDAGGNLYGTTHYGGMYAAGTVFKLDTAGKETVMYSFTGGDDGGYPWAGLIQDRSGNLYGTTGAGGSYSQGTVFKLDPSGHETVLHSFTGSDGAFPAAALTPDAGGNLYGTTLEGGTYGSGTVFKIMP